MVAFEPFLLYVFDFLLGKRKKHIFTICIIERLTLSVKDKVLDKLRQGLQSLDEDATEAAAVEAVEKGVDALKAASVLTETIRDIGEKFSRFELFLPDLLLATDAMNKALAVLEPELKKGAAEAPSMGTVVSFPLLVAEIDAPLAGSAESEWHEDPIGVALPAAADGAERWLTPFLVLTRSGGGEWSARDGAI